MSEKVLDEHDQPRLLHHMASLLDEEFGFKTLWHYEREWPDNPEDRKRVLTAFVHSEKDQPDRIRVNPHHVDALVKGAKVASEHEELCYFYVMAHEKAHAYQVEFDRARGVDPVNAYQSNGIWYELHADYVTGGLHFLHQLLKIGERKMLNDGQWLDRQYSAFSLFRPEVQAVLKSFVHSIGSPSTHGSGEQRVMEFLWGRSWVASSLTNGNGYVRTRKEFLEASWKLVKVKR